MWASSHKKTVKVVHIVEETYYDISRGPSIFLAVVFYEMQALGIISTTLASSDQSWNMELDLQSLFGLHVHSCSHWPRPRNPPPPHSPAFGLIYEGAIGQPRYKEWIAGGGGARVQLGPNEA